MRLASRGNCSSTATQCASPRSCYSHAAALQCAQCDEEARGDVPQSKTITSRFHSRVLYTAYEQAKVSYSSSLRVVQVFRYENDALSEQIP